MPKEKAWDFNQQRNAADEIGDTSELNNSSVPYTREMFDALILRYEEPIANNRWDKPLFTILPESTINFDDVNAALYESKPPPPNLATQNVRKEKDTGKKLVIYRAVFMFLCILKSQSARDFVLECL